MVICIGIDLLQLHGWNDWTKIEICFGLFEYFLFVCLVKSMLCVHMTIAFTVAHTFTYGITNYSSNSLHLAKKMFSVHLKYNYVFFFCFIYLCGYCKSGEFILDGLSKKRDFFSAIKFYNWYSIINLCRSYNLLHFTAATFMFSLSVRVSVCAFFFLSFWSYINQTKWEIIQLEICVCVFGR